MSCASLLALRWVGLRRLRPAPAHCQPPRWLGLTAVLGLRPHSRVARKVVRLLTGAVKRKGCDWAVVKCVEGGDKKFSEKHEWVEVESGEEAKVGITHYAQEALGELVYIQPPDEVPIPLLIISPVVVLIAGWVQGTELTAGEECGTVESVKAASDIYSPISGTVTAANAAVIEEPKLVNTNAEDLGSHPIPLPPLFSHSTHLHCLPPLQAGSSKFA